MEKSIKELNLEDDFLFAKVISDKEICKELLESILKIKIEKLEMPEEQKVINLLLDSKGIRLDIYVKDENSTVYNIEMQRCKKKQLAKRFRYYQGNIDLDLISKGEDYTKLKKSYVIFICTFDLFGKGRHVYTFENICLEDHSIKLQDESQKIILNTRGVINDADEELLEFLNYIEDSSDEVAKSSKGNLVKHIHEKVTKVKASKEMEVEYMTILERDREKMEEGMHKRELEIAKNLLDVLDDKTISLKTGLDIEKVKELRVEEKKKYN